MALHRRPTEPAHRLMSKEQAASYCNMDVKMFLRTCPVGPKAFPDHIHRWDRNEIDDWLDNYGGDNLTAEDWLRRIADDQDRRSINRAR